MNKRRRYLAKRRRAQAVKNIRFWHHGLDAVIRMATMTMKRFDVPDGYGFSIEPTPNVEQEDGWENGQ
jgi:hypothetical protein